MIIDRNPRERIAISNINVTELFGKDYAQDDENLKHYFIKTRQYRELKSGSRYLVLGRKGSGKSALFKMLADETAQTATIPVKIAFDVHDFIQIENILKQNNITTKLNDDFRYSLAWQDFLISEIIQSALKKGADTFGDDNLLKRHLVDQGFLKEGRVMRFAESLINVVKGINYKGDKYSIDLNFQPLKNIAQADQDLVNDAINYLFQNNNFFVLIDNLDEPWKNNIEMNSWLRGLVFAIRNLKSAYNNLRIIAFLRTDIFDVISKESDLFDARSEITTISWDDNAYYNLKSLVAARIAYYFNLEYNDTSEINDMWDRVFPKYMIYNGKQNNMATYMIDRTLLRPRELLQFCREVVSSSQTRFLPCDQNAVNSAEVNYSYWKVTDLAGEYSNTCLNIDKCILSFANTRRNWRWPVSDVLKHLDNLESSDRLVDSNNNRIYSSKEALEQLYRINFFRKAIIMPQMRTRYRLYHQDNSINYNTTIFDIHPAFRKRFTTY